ncbi:hypothetical protein Tco_1371469 [Tanacetum coccineum]
MSHPHPKRSFVPKAVLTRSGKLSTASAAVNTVRPVNTANTKAVNTARPVNTAASKQTHFQNKCNTDSGKQLLAEDRAVVRICVKLMLLRPQHAGFGKPKIADNPQQKEYKEKAVIDSGCSRHMTGNKCYLDEYEDYDGGLVSFGDGKGRISGKGADIVKITRKRLKPGKNKHGNGRARKEPGECYQSQEWSTQVNLWST